MINDSFFKKILDELMKLMKILPMKVATGTETLRSKRRKKRKNEWIRLGKN